MSSQIQITPDETSFYKKAATYFMESAARAIRENNSFIVSLSGGSTPKRLYTLLSEDYYRHRVDWAHVHFFWGDERCVPPDHSESNFGMTKLALLSKIPIPPQNIHRIPGEMEPPRDAARAYQKDLKSFFKLDYSIPQFDLILLGVGEDGHTASLFPATEALKEKERLVVANFVSRFNAYRITMTYPLLNYAKKIIFLCAGLSKAKILSEIHRKDRQGILYPAEQVKTSKGETIWLLDRSAASKLPNEVRFQAAHLS